MRGRSPGPVSRSQEAYSRKHAPSGIDGLLLVWTNVTTVTVQVGSCRDSTDSFDMELGSTQAVAITASGAAGLDTGSESSGTATWYYVYLVQGTPGTSAVLSTNASTPTLPAGYKYYRRIGAVMNWTDDDLQDFDMLGSGRVRTTYWNERPAEFQKALDAGVSHSAWAEVSVANFVSPKADEFYIQVSATAGASNNVRLRAKDYTPTGASGTNTTQLQVAANMAQYNVVWMNCGGTKSFEHYHDNAASRLTATIRAFRETL